MSSTTVCVAVRTCLRSHGLKRPSPASFTALGLMRCSSSSGLSLSIILFKCSSLEETQDQKVDFFFNSSTDSLPSHAWTRRWPWGWGGAWLGRAGDVVKLEGG